MHQLKNIPTCSHMDAWQCLEAAFAPSAGLAEPYKLRPWGLKRCLLDLQVQIGYLGRLTVARGAIGCRAPSVCAAADVPCGGHGGRKGRTRNKEAEAEGAEAKQCQKRRQYAIGNPEVGGDIMNPPHLGGGAGPSVCLALDGGWVCSFLARWSKCWAVCAQRARGVPTSP